MNKKLRINAADLTLESQQRMKRSSKICSALKTRFFQILYEEGTTIKYAAKHLGINYSTAKVIAKENRHLLKEKATSNSDYEEQYLPSKTKKVQVIKKQAPRCSYILIESNQNEPNNTFQKASVVQVISTVAWNFLEEGIPQTPTQQIQKYDSN